MSARSKAHNRGSIALAALAAAAAPALGHAQADTYFDRSRNSSVLERPRPEYAPLGVHLGGFTLSPKITISPEYDDNIYATTNNQQGDFITVVEPEISAESNWSRHELNGYARVISSFYASQGTQSTTDYELGAGGRLDVHSTLNLTGGFSYAHDTEARTAENTVSNARYPVEYDVIGARIGAAQPLNRFQFSENLVYAKYSYQNTVDYSGNPLLQGYRNREDTVLTGRADYGLTPSLSVFISLAANDRPYDEKPPLAAINRDSTGYEATIGTTFDITRLTRGHIEVGYLEQNYTSKLFKPVTGAAFHANVAYFATELTTITVGLDRTVNDAADPSASSVLSTTGTFQIDHELLRNVIITGRAAYENDAFSGYNRVDDRATASLSASYLVNRHVTLTASYTFLNEDSSGVNRIPNYVVNVAALSLVFQL